jgi:Lon protease-like protein
MMEIPLFPLNTVLFPGCTLDLQIFEPRYLDMVSRCMKQGQGFGVVALLEGREAGPAATHFAGIGCEALIRDWSQRPNGLLGLRVEGGRRFAVQSSRVQADQLLLGEVEFQPEVAGKTPGPEEADLQALLEVLVAHPMVLELQMNAGAESQAALADKLGYLLPFSREQKLELLVTAEPASRLASIQQWLDVLQDDAG